MPWAAVASAVVGAYSANQQKKAAKSGSTTKQEMDPAMRPYIFGADGQKGLLDYNTEQLGRSQSPERQQMWGNMMNRGQQLLGGSVAGNPFSAGYTGGSNFGAVGGGLAGNGIPKYTPSLLAPPPAQQPQLLQQQPPALTMEEIMAEWERRRQLQMYSADMLSGGPGNGFGADGSSDGVGGIGSGAAGDGGMGNSGEGGGGPGSPGW